MAVIKLGRLEDKAFRKTADLILALGILVALVGGGKFFLAQTATASSGITVTPGPIIQRQEAIAEALKTGRKTYSFTTNFIPGIGTVSDPDQYKAGVLQQLQNLRPSAN